MNKQLEIMLAEAKVDVAQVGDVLEYAQTAIKLAESYEKHLELKASGIDDETTIKLAGELRKTIKKDRTSSSKFLKQKRTEVQKEMEVYVMKDKALLKIDQYQEAKAKEVEAHLEAIERLPEIEEQKRLDAIEQERVANLESIGVDSSIYNVREMSEEAFQAMFAGIKFQKENEEKIHKEQEEKEAKEKELEAIFQKRLVEVQQYRLIPGSEPLIDAISKETTAESYEKIKSSLIEIFNKYQEEQIKVRQEAERNRLALEKQQKEKEEADRKLQEAQALEEKARKEKEEAEKKVKEEEARRQTAQRRQNTLLENGFKFKDGYFKYSSKNLKVSFDTDSLLHKSEEDFDKCLSPVLEDIQKQKSLPLLSWVESFEIPPYEVTEDVDLESKRQEIIAKFEAFKNWASKL